MGFKYCKSIYWAPSERNQVNGGKCYGMYLVIWLLNGTRKGIERASGFEEARKLGNGEGVMLSVAWAPKCPRDRAQRGRAAGKVSVNVERRRTSAARAKQRTHSARKRDALLTPPFLFTSNVVAYRAALAHSLSRCFVHARKVLTRSIYRSSAVYLLAARLLALNLNAKSSASTRISAKTNSWKPAQRMRIAHWLGTSS